MRPLDSSHDLLKAAQPAITGLLVAALAARSLCELKQIDGWLTRDVFDALCGRGIPMPHVSEFVWPAVAALEQRAVLLGASWRPTLCQGDQPAPMCTLEQRSAGDGRTVCI